MTEPGLSFFAFSECLKHPQVLLHLLSFCCSHVLMEGAAALHYAAEAGHAGVVASLVIAGCHVSTGTTTGWTASHLAAYFGHTAALEKLLLGGYEVDCTSGSGGWTALHLAARRGHLQVRVLSVSCPLKQPQGVHSQGIFSETMAALSIS